MCVRACVCVNVCVTRPGVNVVHLVRGSGINKSTEQTQTNPRTIDRLDQEDRKEEEEDVAVHNPPSKGRQTAFTYQTNV